MVQTNSLKPKILILTGPTAVGKSKAAVCLAQKFNGEVIGADSMQIYKGFDIGTGKISESEKQGVPHYMIDILEPYEEFSVGDFVERAKLLIGKICAAGKLPIVVGGTVLYINALLSGFDFANAPKNIDFRNKLNEDADRFGVESLFEKLKTVDPMSAQKIQPNDKRRIIRALEIYHITGRPKSEIAQSNECPFDYELLVLTDERASLYERIEKRVDEMVAAGLENEVKKFLRYRDCQSMQAIGYKEFVEYFDGKIDFDETVEKIKMNSRHYAKRQLTFIKSLKFDKTEANYKDYDRHNMEILRFLERKN